MDRAFENHPSYLHSATCTKLNLDRYPSWSPEELHTILGSLSQLSNLQQLNLQYGSGAIFRLEVLSSFNNLQALRLSNRPHYDNSFLDGCVEALPSSITTLQLCHCTMDAAELALMLGDLTHLKLLRDLDLSGSFSAFGSSGFHADMKGNKAQSAKFAASCTSAGLCTQLTRLIWSDAHVHMYDAFELLAFSALRVFCLRDASIGSSTCNSIGLKDLVHSMRHLEELDILRCRAIHVSSPDYKRMRLSRLSLDYQQFKNSDKSWFEYFVVHEQDSASLQQLFKPFLRMDCGENTHCGTQTWTFEAPFFILTHLTICDADKWPGVFEFLSDLHQLLVLDLRFVPGLYQNSSPACRVVSLNSTAKLTELYIAYGSYITYDLAHCTTLSVLGLIQKGEKPALHLPPFLTKLYLFNILSASTDLGLDTLSDLTSIQLGGKVTGTDATQQLPPLPPTVVELDLWDGVLTDLQQLTRLTNLKKLSMPDPPTKQQLHVMRQLRQLRHLEQTSRHGMLYVCYELAQADM